MLLPYLLYWLVVIFELVFSFGIAVYSISLLVSSFKGAPYVPTKNKEIDVLLEEAKLKKGQLFFDLGCGDGRVVRIATERYGVRGIGYDVNPVLVRYARFLAKIKKVKGVQFFRKNIFDVDLKEVDVIYIFLMPKLMAKFLPKMKKELRKNTLIISHGFKVEGLEKKLFKKLDRKPFPTYFYRI